MFISPSIWIISVYTSVEWPQTKIWGGPKVVLLFIYF